VGTCDFGEIPLTHLHRHAVSLVAAILLSTMAPRLYAQVRIAVVDLQRALNETDDGRRAKARLKRLFKQRQTDLDERQNELKALKEEIERASEDGTLSESALRTRAEEYQKAFVELQSTYMEYQRELAEKEAEMTSTIIERMERILVALGESERYDLILERGEGGVIWTSATDLTSNLVERYNAGEGRTGGGGDDDDSASSGSGGGSGGSGASGGAGAGSSTKRRRGAAAGGGSGGAAAGGGD
jgi:outer membrane protein